MDRNIVNQNPDDMLRNRAVIRLMSTGEIDAQPDSARGALVGLTNAQIQGVGNLGLSLEQVQHPNYTDHTPSAITAIIYPNLDTDSLTSTLDNLDTTSAQNALVNTNNRLERPTEEGGISVFDRLMQLDETQQQGVALGFDTDEIKHRIFTQNNFQEMQELVGQQAFDNLHQAFSQAILDQEFNRSEPDTSDTGSVTNSSGRSSPELSVQEQLNPLPFASMPARRPESPDEGKDSFVEKELKRKRDSDSSLQHSDSSDTDDERKAVADPNKKPRGR